MLCKKQINRPQKDQPHIKKERHANIIKHHSRETR